MKKLLVIVGSPRKGETYHAIEKFEATLKKYAEVEVEYIMLSKIGLLDCTGCHNCIMKGHTLCRESAKVQELVDKMKSADAVVLASPVYNQHVTALMKKFLDYLSYLWHRPEMFGVNFLGISSGGGRFGEVFKFLKSNVQSWGGTWIGSLGVPHYEDLTPKYKAKSDQDFEKKAQLLLTAMERKALPAPTFMQLMMFNVWKMNARACKSSIPADYDYWKNKELFDKPYYYKTRIGIFKRLSVKLINAISKGMMKKIYKTYSDC